jgi:PAS domain S-box-containing protein
MEKYSDYYRRQLEAICNNTTLALFIMDERQQCIYMNPAAEQMTGYTLAEAQGRSLHYVIHHTRPDGTFYPIEDCPIDRAFPENNREQGEEVFVHKDGHFYPVAFTASPIREGGSIVGTIIEVRDITERKRMEEEILRLNHTLKQRVDELQALLDIVPIGIAIAHDPECQVITTNPAGAKMLNISPEENASKSRPDADRLPFKVMRNGCEVPPDELPMQQATAHDVTLFNMDFDIVHDDGRVVHLYEYASPLHDERGRVRGCVGVFVDITERKRAEEELRKSEERFRELFENANDIVFTLDLGGNMTSVNKAIERILGYARVELLNYPVTKFVAPEYHKLLIEMRARKLAGERVTNYELEVIAKDGRRLVLEVSSRLIYEGGDPIGLQGIARDVTERRRAEEALREADRRKDEFLAMLANELRNPLAPIRNAAQVLKLLNIEEPKAQWAREVIERQTQSLSHIVDDLLDVSRITKGKITLHREPLELATIVSRAIETSRPLIDARHHELSVSVPPESLRVEGDLTRLAQVLSNLLNNAAKYTDECGKISLTVLRENDRIALRVRDTGVGIAPDVLPHIFDLFIQADRSLDRSEGGLGLGLTLVRHLVEMHSGTVEAHSDGPGRGSEFVVHLPLLSAAERPSEDSPAIGAATPAALRVLVVEDNIDSAEMLAIMLQLEGHQVRTAHDGSNAIKVAITFRPDVALIDIGLPEMDGYEVARRLRELPQTQKMVLIALTGYGQAEDRRRTRDAGFDHHLVKPVEPDALEALLNSIARGR